MNNIETIGSSSFRGTNMKEVNLVHCLSLQSIGEFAFSEMSNLEKVSLPPKTTIGVGCFSNCPQLTDVSLSPYLSEISAKSFENCRNLVSIPIPPSVEIIGAWSFSCTSIEWIRIGNMVTVHPNAFSCCRSLTTIEVFDYAFISKNAFRNSNAIENVVLYEFVTIEEDAFSCKPKFSYFGQANVASVMTTKCLKKIGIDSIDVTENYIYEKYCDINVNKVQVNKQICEEAEKCSSAPFYDDYFRQALAIKKSQIKLFCLLHRQNK